MSVSKVLDPSKSPLKRETLMTVPPFLRVRGDLKMPKVTAKPFMATLPKLSNNLLVSETVYQLLPGNCYTINFYTI